MFAIFSLQRPDILPVGTYHNEVSEVVNQSLMSQAISVYSGASFVGYYHSTSQSTESSYHQRNPPRSHERPKTNPGQTRSRNPQSPEKMPRPRAVSLLLTKSWTRTRTSKGKPTNFLAYTGSLTRLRPVQLGVWIKLQRHLPKTRRLSSLPSLHPSQTC
jgi:hypothetical protein